MGDCLHIQKHYEYPGDWTVRVFCAECWVILGVEEYSHVDLCPTCHQPLPVTEGD